MTELKCPFCQQELEIGGVDGILRGCPKCRNLGTEMLWQELIRTKELLKIESSEHDLCHDALVKRTKELDSTRKALDVAVDALKLFDSGKYTPQSDAYGLKRDASRLAHKALEQITALEQKDK